MNGISQEFTCICGKQKGWISDEKETLPCPSCGRVYRGVYDRKTYCIKPVVVRKRRHNEKTRENGR